MVKTKQTARKTNTLGMSTYQDDSTSSSSSGDGVATDVEESRQEGDKSRYNWPIFTGGEGKVTQAPEGGQIKHKVFLEYSSDEVSESQLDQISPEYPTVADIAKIKKMKKSVKLTIPCHLTVEGLTELFIAWYKDHSMTTSLRKALKANGWTEQMIHEFKQVYIRKYKILQDYAMRYPDEKLSDEDELEEGGLADLVDPQREQHLKDSEKGADGSISERTTKKKKAKKTSPSDPPGEGKKKAVKCKGGQGNEPWSITSEAPPEKNRRGNKRRRGRQRQMQLGRSQRRKRPRGPPQLPSGGCPMQNHRRCQKCHQELPQWPWNRGPAWTSSWRPICLVWTPQPWWPSKARPCPVQQHPRSRTWEVSWPDSENLFPGPEHDRCWWPLLFRGGPSSPGYQFPWLKFRQPSPQL